MKADPYTPPEAIFQAEKELAEAEAIHESTSEMSQIRNLHWWTVEYGLIGDIKNPKIYGAGLLSSIGESYSSLQPKVKKIPYSLDAVNFNFDITTRQPQLFVTPDFECLTKVLNEYADTMALRTGGADGIIKAIESGYTGTCVYSSGLQVSGGFQEVIIHRENPVYIRTEGPSQLCINDKQLTGHGTEYHGHGFSSPVGKLKDTSSPLECCSDGDLGSIGIIKGQKVLLEFESGVIVDGFLENILREHGKILLMTFSGCRVTFRDRLLFDQAWGKYDMAVGEKIISVYSGPADPYAFKLSYPVPKEKTHKIIHSEKANRLHHLYQTIRNFRENKSGQPDLRSIFTEIRKDYPEEWLLPLEIMEMIHVNKEHILLEKEIRDYLLTEKGKNPDIKRLVENGLKILYPVRKH
jgi:phenylalanine-4-hydroxylase